MKDYLQGWKNVKDVYIPPVKQKGFKENVIIRKYMPAKKVERIVMEMEEDDATVFVPMDEDYDDDRSKMKYLNRLDSYILLIMQTMQKVS